MINFSFKKRAALAAAIGILSSAELSFAATTYTWDGGVGGTGTDVNTAANWNPDGLPVFSVGSGDTVVFASTSPVPVGGVAQSGHLATRFLNFNAGAGAYTWNIGANNFGIGSATNTANRGTISNLSTNTQVFNIATGGSLAVEGTLNTTAGGGDLVINGNLAVNTIWNAPLNTLQVQNSNSVSGFTDLAGTGNFYFNVNSSINPLGNDTAPGWVHGGGTTTVATNRGYLIVSTSGTVYMGNIGPDFRGTMQITSTTGGKLRLTHNNSLGASATGNGVEIDGGTTGNGTMELVGGITVGRDQLWLDGRSGSVANANHVLNVSGNNTMTFNSWKTGISAMNARAGYASAGNWNIQSDSGLLTIGAGNGTGAITNDTHPAVANPGLITLNLKGAGNGQIDQQILKTGANSSVNIVKSGTGTWTLTNPNSFDNGTLHAYDGNVSVTAGTLALSGSGSLANAASIEVKSGATFDFTAANGGIYTLNSANVLLKGAGTIIGSLTAGFGNTIAPGDAGIGTLTVNGNLSLNGDSTLTYQLSNNPSGSNDKIAVNGSLNVSGVTTVGVSGPIVAGNYPLIDYTGSLSGFVPGSSFTITGVGTFRQTFTVVNDNVNTVLNLNVSGSGANLTWVGDNVSNVWDTVGATNWNGAPDHQFFSNDNVTFDNTGSVSPSVNVSGSVAPGVMTLSNSSGHDYTFVGGDIVATTLNATGTGTNTFSNSNLIVNGAFTKSGSGNVVLNPTAVTFNGSVNIGGTGAVSITTGGTITTASPIAINTTGSGSLTINIPFDTSFNNSVSGSGTLRKDGVGTTLTIGGNNLGFTGTFLVAEGTGKTNPGIADTLGTAGVTVSPGATFDVNGANLKNTIVTIEGTGVGGAGALTDAHGTGSNFLGNVKGVILANDAKISAAANSFLFVAGTDMDGASASFQGNGKNVTFDVASNSEIDLVNVGNMNVNNISIGGGGAVYIAGNTTLGPTTGTLTLLDKGRLAFYGSGGFTGVRASTGLIDKPIVVDATANGGEIEVYRGNNTVNSPITMNGNLSVEVLARDDGTWRQTLAGNLTGVGNLTVHGISATAARIGLVELTSSSNSYGTTTIGGGASVFNTVTDANDRVILSVGNGGTTGKLGTGAVTLGTSATLRFNRSNSHTVSNDISGAGNVDQVAVGGTATLSGASLTYTGNTTVTAGTLNITGSHTSGTNYSVASGANLITNNVRVTNGLTVNGTVTINTNGGTAGASKAETLTIGAGGKLNLKDNDFVVGTAANVTAVRGAIALGKTNNAVTGITSDLPAFAVSTGFGYALGNDAAISPLLAGSLAGQTYDADSILVKYTFLGDADLDGDSDLNDLGLWAQSFTGDLGNPVTPVTFWTSGDFDYDGDTDLNDLGFWASTFTGDLGGGAGSLIVVATNAPAGAVAALNSMGITVAVPEPSTFVLAGVGLAGLAVASRRKRSA